MNDLDVLKGLLGKVYAAGWRDGNALDNGCRPEDFGDLDAALAEIGAGDLASAMAALLSIQEPALPDLQPGVQIPFRQGNYVIRDVTRDLDGSTVVMQDYASYERANMIQAVPSSADHVKNLFGSCPHTGCDLAANHPGLHAAIMGTF